MRPLTIALPKGRLFKDVINILHKAGYLGRKIDDDSRRLLLSDESSGLNFILAKPTDVPTYVEYGAADLGVVGKDVLLEEAKDVCELLDLGLGGCRLVVAVRQETGFQSLQDFPLNGRVASKYPRVAGDFFLSHGIQVDLIKLHGSIELAPMVGLADAIVDITSTGETLRQNGLKILAEITPCTARLIANPVSFKMEFDRIHRLAQAVRKHVQDSTLTCQD
ncbi:MAG TPA: ATP phosphoribosyltransferase [Bacillota bacterium]